MDDQTKLMEEIALDLWHRFRAMALAIDQAQRFVALPSEGETINEKELWLSHLPEHPEEIEEIANDLVLRAFRAALEPTNYLILQTLKHDTSISISDLMKVTEWNLMSVSERVNDLIQVGLAVKDVQTGQVQATRAGQGLMEWMQEMQNALKKTIQEKFQSQGTRGRPQE